MHPDHRADFSHVTVSCIPVTVPLPDNRTSTEPLPYAATAPAQMQGNARLEDPLQITSAKIDIVGLQHALFVGVPRPDPACELQCRL